jgi:hypothetical protein
MNCGDVASNLCICISVTNCFSMHEDARCTLGHKLIMYLANVTEPSGEAHLSKSDGKTLKYFTSNYAINCYGHFNPVLIV